jgi:hypothetical protein
MTKVEPHRELLAYELQERAAPPPRRRRRPGRLAGAVVAAALLILIGFGAGVLARNSAVDDQQRRAASAEQQNSSLRQQVASKQSASPAATTDRSELRNDARRQVAQKLLPLTPPTNRVVQRRAVSGGCGSTRQYHRRVRLRYWAKLSTGDTNRVIVNHVGGGPQTVTIDSPYFESEVCGTWTKVG